MSKYVDEIIKDIKENPETFKDYKGFGLEKGRVKLYGFGNTALLSVIDVEINDKVIPTSYIDLWRLEVIIKRWYRTMSLSVISV